MEYTNALKKITDAGVKQSTLEKYCHMTPGKITEILRGRALITNQLVAQTIEGVGILVEQLNEASKQLQEAYGEEDTQFLVYEFIFPNNKKYYGHTYNTDARWREGKGYKNQKVGKAIEEFGWDNIQKRIIAENLSKENAEMIERSLIKGTGSDLDLIGYNSI